MLGRAEERERVDALLRDVEAGQSGSLVVRGDAGVGKTVLLDYAAERGTGRGMRVLRARGVESESRAAFAGLAEIVHPLLGRLPEIPAPQRDSLVGALAIGPPAATDRFTISAATLSLLAVEAESTPVLIVIDDAHWLDVASLAPIAFVARRLVAEGVAMLFAVRRGWASALDGAGLDVLELEGVDAACGRELLAARLDRPVVASVADVLHRATRGNPLLMVELAAVLSPAQLQGAEALPVPLPVGSDSRRLFQPRLAVLPAATRSALAVAAAEEPGGIDEVLSACLALGIASDAFEPAERVGLVSLDNVRVEFAHPLVRSAAYYGVAAPERRRAHRALADVLAQVGDDEGAERRAWHLAAATVGTDDHAADALEEAGQRARGRCGWATASAAFERSGSLTREANRRARRLLQAGEAAFMAGQVDRAAALLAEAARLADEGGLHAEIILALGFVEVRCGHLVAARQLLEAEATIRERVDDRMATILYCGAALADLHRGQVGSAVATARKAAVTGGRAGGEVAVTAAVHLQMALFVHGEGHPAGPLGIPWPALVQAVEHLDITSPAFTMVLLAGSAYIWNEEFERARKLIEATVHACRSASAFGSLAVPLAWQSMLEFRTGHWALAMAAGEESLEFAVAAGMTLEAVNALARITQIQAARGQAEQCRASFSRTLQISEGAEFAFIMLGRAALGLLDLSLGNHIQAINQLEAVAEEVDELGVGPAVVMWEPDLIEAYLGADRLADAERLLEVFEREAQATGRRWALAAAARCRGLLAGGDDFERHFVDARSWHETLPMPFETARTQLAYGRCLRRARQRGRARVPLRAALRVFEALGASRWAYQARKELEATGDKTVSADAPILHSLTAQELRVAFLVAGGATNKEAAASLFLSAKTVEFHLAKAYRKLGVTSRTQLAHVLAKEERLLWSP